MSSKLLDHLGLPGVLGLGLALFCLSFQLGAISPSEGNLRTLQTIQAQKRAELSEARTDVVLMKKSVTLASAGAIPTLPNKLREISDAIGSSLDRVDFKQAIEGNLTRTEATLRLKASYPDIRKFLNQTFDLAPLTTLDSIQLDRPSRTDTTIEAQMLISFYFSSP